MPKDHSPETDDQMPEKRSSQQLLLLLLLLLIILFGYLYFFTGVIKPRTEQPKPQPVAEAPVKTPLPPRPEGGAKPAPAAAAKGEEAKGAAPAAAKPGAPAKETAGAKPVPAGAKEVASAKSAAGGKEAGAAKPAPAKEPAAKAAPSKEAAKPAAKPAPAAAAAKPAAEQAGAKKNGSEKPAAQAKGAHPSAGAKVAKAVAGAHEPAAKPGAPKAAAAAQAKGAEKSGAAAKPKTAAKAAYVLVLSDDIAESEMGAVLAKLKKAGVGQVVQTKTHKGEAMHRLFLADFANRDEALEELERLKLAAPDAFMLKENGRYAVYAGSYLRDAKATGEHNRLQKQGVQTLMKSATVPVVVLKVRAGAFADQAGAERAVQSLKKAGLSAKVVRLSKAEK